MIERLLSRFREPIEMEMDEVVGTIRDRRKDDFDELQEKVDKKRDRLEEKIDSLQDLIEELEEFEDQKDRAIVEDVVENIKEERQRLINDVSYPDDPRDLEKEIRSFLNSFKTMSRKEAAVMKTIPVNKDMDEVIEQVEAELSELEGFIELEYSDKEGFERIKELTEKREDLREEIEQKQKRSDGLDLGELESKIQEKEKELEQLREDERWEDYTGLKDELRETKRRKTNLNEREGKAINKMERGLKKLIYRIENTGIEFDGDMKILKKIRDRKKEDIEDIDSERIEDTVKKAMDAMPEGLVKESQHKKFVEGVETLGNISNTRGLIEDHEDKIEELREKIDDHEVIKREEELASEKKELKTRLEEMKKRKERLEKELEELSRDLDETEEEIKGTTRSVLEKEVEFVENDEERIE